MPLHYVLTVGFIHDRLECAGRRKGPIGEKRDRHGKELETLGPVHRRGQDTSPGWREADEFDDRFVAPRNGFRNAMDYSRRTAGALRLSRITVPTLMLHARNDPWIPVGPYVGLQAAAPTNVMIKVTQSRGHVGFHEHGYADTWHDRMIDACLTERNAGVATASGL